MKNFVIAIGLVILFGAMVCPAPLSAAFDWVDHNGNTRHTKYPPQPHQVKKYLKSPQNQVKSKAKVDLYVTSWCPYCHKAKEFFQARNIAVNVYDIEKDKKAAARKRKLDPRKGVPFAVVNGRAIHGFAPEQYLRALKGK